MEKKEFCCRVCLRVDCGQGAGSNFPIVEIHAPNWIITVRLPCESSEDLSNNANQFNDRTCESSVAIVDYVGTHK